MSIRPSFNIPPITITRKNNHKTEKHILEIEKYIEFAKKKFIESLFYLKTTTKNTPSAISNRNARANIYIQSIINALELQSLIKFKNIDELFKYLISKVIDFKSSFMLGSKSPFPITEHNFLFYHGGPTFSLKIVPANCIICFTTPINYFGCPNLSSIRNFTDFIISEQESFTSKFIKADNLGVYHEFLKTATIFYPGQFYFDVRLSFNEQDKTTFQDLMGLYEHSGFQMNILEHKKIQLLSGIIEEWSLGGLIIVSCCRSYDYEPIARQNTSGQRQELTSISYRYEHLINILNTAVKAKNKHTNNNNKEYYSLLTQNKSVEIRKVRNNKQYNKNISTLTKNEQQFGNKSLGLAKFKPSNTGLTHNILRLLYDHQRSEDILYEQLDKEFFSGKYPIRDDKLYELLKKLDKNSIPAFDTFKKYINSKIGFVYPE